MTPDQASMVFTAECANHQKAPSAKE